MKQNSTNVRIIAVAGGTSSGKTTFATAIVEAACRALPSRLPSNPAAVLLSMDSYYKSDEQVVGLRFRHDNPDAFNLSVLANHLKQLRLGKPIEVPSYSFMVGQRTGSVTVEAAPLIVVEGIYALHDIIATQFDLRLWIESSTTVRFQRRLARDQAERGRPPEEIKHRFDSEAEPALIEFAVPLRDRYADLIVRNEGEFPSRVVELIAGIARL